MKEQAVESLRVLQKLDQTKAKALSNQIETIFPAGKDNDVDFLVTYAAVLGSEGSVEAALAVYRRVILLKPSPEIVASVYSGMGDSYRGLKKTERATASYQQALVLYQRLLRTKPRDASLQYGLGHAYLDLGQKDQALQVYRRLALIDKSLAQDLFEEIKKVN
jgi:tetratricopeptide (TPR) repeat protein